MAIPQNMLDAQARNQDAVDNGVTPGAEPLGQVAAMKQTGIANAVAPQLSVSGNAPQVTPPVVAPVSPDIKYGGNRVIGPNGEPNIGTNGYPGVDVFKLGSVANATDANDAIKRINENQANSINVKEETPPPLAPGYSMPAQASTGLTPEKPKTALDQYMDFLTSSMTEKKTPTFNAEQAQNELFKNADIQSAQDKVNTLDAQEQQILANKQARIDAQTLNGSVPLDVAAGRIGEIERQENTRLQEIGRLKKIALNTLQTKQDMVQSLMKAKQYDYETAREDYKTQFTNQMQMMNLFRGLQSDAREEKAAETSAINAAEKAKMEARDKERDDARANIGIMYNNITSGGFDPMKMSEQEQIQWAKQEMLAGLPAGTFYNLASTSPNQEVKGQNDYTDSAGNKMTDIIMQDRSTGAITVKTVRGGTDVKAGLEMKKLQTEVNNLPLDTLIKKYNITEKEQQIVKNRADIANIPYDMELKKLALSKAQMEGDKTYASTYELNPDFALGAEASGVNHFGVKYGKGVEANSSGINQGTDISIPVGTPVALPKGDWKVIDAKTGVTGGNLKDYKKSPYGNSVLVQNTQTGEKLRMSHLSEVGVSNGTVLKGGQVIGKSGATGNVSGAHLDLEYYDPNGKIADIRSSGYASSYLGKSTKVKANAGKDMSQGEKLSEAVGFMAETLQNRAPSIPKTLGDAYNYSGDKLPKSEYSKYVEAWQKKGFDKDSFDKNFGYYFEE